MRYLLPEALALFPHQTTPPTSASCHPLALSPSQVNSSLLPELHLYSLRFRTFTSLTTSRYPPLLSHFFPRASFSAYERIFHHPAKHHHHHPACLHPVLRFEPRYSQKARQILGAGLRTDENASTSTMPGPLTSQQKAVLTEFMGITHADTKTAAKLLQKHGWNTSAAMNTYVISFLLIGRWCDGAAPGELCLPTA